jgi:hypothetical protein
MNTLYTHIYFQFKTMISSSGIVHIAALFAIVVIMVTEIKLGKDHCSWLPILTTIIGYLMPQPKFTNPKKRMSSSMLHLDADFARVPNGSNPAAASLDGTDIARDPVVQPKSKSYRTLFLESLPSVALFTAVAVWAAISLSSSDMFPASRNNNAVTTVSYDVQGSTAASMTRLDRQDRPQSTLDERFGSSSVCEYLHGTAELNGICNDRSLNHVVQITNGTLGMCYVKNKEIAARVEINNATFSSGYTGWRLLLFRMSRISDRLHKANCYDMTLGYKSETASSCNDRVTITGYPDVITLSAHQWNDMVFYIPDVLLAMLKCRPYTPADN